MPWSAADASRHKKGLSPEESHKWAVIANHALDEYHDEGQAIRVANSRTRKTSRRPARKGTR